MLIAWGAANVVVGSLVLAGATESGPVDEYALRWHVFLWDSWFVAWGLALAWAARSAWHARKGS